MKVSLIITEALHEVIYDHLYPGDGLEAVAVCLCGRQSDGKDKRLLVHKVIPIPYSECVRKEGFVNWSTRLLEPMLLEASTKNMALLKIHSHPGGYDQFSSIDDNSDKELFQSVYGWMDDVEPHASAIMLPDGRIFGRTVDQNQQFHQLTKVTRIGKTITYWTTQANTSYGALDLRNLQAFGEGTISVLKGMTIGIVGCSGTGSPVVEQLSRLGVGRLVLIDPDKIEEKNINRILNSKRHQADEGLFKVDVLADAVRSMGFGTEVIELPFNAYDKLALKQLSNCDVIFGCVDSVDGRHLLNQLATFYLIPYFDLGVRLDADGKGSVSQICGTVHYIVPGGSSLMSRGVYSHEDLTSASLFRTNPSEHNALKQSGYITNVNVDRPAVISVNMLTASLAVNEFLARIHNYRTEDDGQFATTRFSLTDGYFMFDNEGKPDEYLRKFVGRGDSQPPLNMPELSF